MLILGFIFVLNSGLIFFNAAGRIEGYVSAVICLLGGIVNLVYASRKISTPRTSDDSAPS